MKPTIILLGLIAVSQAVVLAPIPNKAIESVRKYKDSEKDRELGSTMDSLKQAEKEVGMKMETPQKLVRTKYDGIGANTPLA